MLKLSLRLPTLGRPRPAPEPWSLDERLLRLAGGDHHTIRDAVNGVVVTGMSGSGKSSGPAEAFATAYLRAGFGGIFHAVKPEDVETALRWCRNAGRAEDVVLFGAGHPARFNFLDHELNRPGVGAGLTDNVVDTLLNVAEIRDRKSGGGGGGGDNAQYFANAQRQNLRACVDLLSRARGRVSVPDIYRLVTSAPTTPEQFRSERWRAESFCFQCMIEASRRTAGGGDGGGAFQADLDNAGTYWCEEFPQLGDRTRSSIVSSVTGTLDSLNRGHVRELLCTGTTFTPDELCQGRILVHTMSAMEYGDVGAMVQVVMKYAAQRAIERRDVRTSPRPVFLHLDEFQTLVTAADSRFALTCRSARAAFLLMTQTLPTIYAALGGGDLAKQQVNSLFANLNLKVFCANSDPETAEWASKLVGKNHQYTINASRSHDADRRPGAFYGGQATAGVTETIDFELQPSALAKLRTGGPANRRCVEAILYRTGTPFRGSGRNWTRTTFTQSA